MDLATFAVNNGFIEAQIRGYRLGFLREEHYNQMKNFHSLEELFQYLAAESDYGEYIDSSNVSVNALKGAMRRKLADEVSQVEMNCSAEVCRFIFFIRATYMIDNVMNILEGIKTGANFKRLLAAIDPLGYFPELNSVEIAGSDLAVLYETVLIDTPISPFFAQYIEANTRELKTYNEVQSFFRDERPEKVRSSLKRIHLEAFHAHVAGLNATSAQIMQDLLALEADFRTIQIVYNSIEDPKNERQRVRETLCPTVGHLYPLHYHALKGVESAEQLREALRGVRNYRRTLAEVAEPGAQEEGAARTLEDAMYEEEVRNLSLVFDQQASLAVLYAYVRLKQQEIRNVVWVSEMISRGLEKNHPAWKKIVVPFA